jgi:hypothetical protein
LSCMTLVHGSCRPTATITEFYHRPSIARVNGASAPTAAERLYSSYARASGI